MRSLEPFGRHALRHRTWPREPGHTDGPVGGPTARARRVARLAFLDDVLQVIPVLDYDREVAEVHAELLAHVRSQGRPRGAHDLIIAATAKTAGRTVVSADDSAFADLPGVQVQTHR